MRVEIHLKREDGREFVATGEVRSRYSSLSLTEVERARLDELDLEEAYLNCFKTILPNIDKSSECTFKMELIP